MKILYLIVIVLLLYKCCAKNDSGFKDISISIDRIYTNQCEEGELIDLLHLEYCFSIKNDRDTSINFELNLGRAFEFLDIPSVYGIYHQDTVEFYGYPISLAAGESAEKCLRLEDVEKLYNRYKQVESSATIQTFLNDFVSHTYVYFKLNDELAKISPGGKIDYLGEPGLILDF